MLSRVGSVFRAAMRWFHDWAEHGWGKWFWIPLSIGVPGAVLTIAQLHKPLADSLPMLLIVGLALMPMAVTYFVEAVRSGHKRGQVQEKSQKEKLYDVYLELVKAIDSVVGLKKDKSSERAREVRRGTVNRTQAMEGCIDPENQLYAIAEAIRAFFQEVCSPSESLTFRVCIIKAKDDRVHDFCVHAPRGKKPKTSLDILKDPFSGFSRVLGSGKTIVIVEDLASEGKKRSKDRCWAVEKDQIGVGSALLYAVHDAVLGHRPYAICVRASEPGVFLRKDKAFYDNLMERFADRICIEHSLSLIKESPVLAVNGPTSTPDTGVKV